MTSRLKFIWSSIGIAALLLIAISVGHGQTANVTTANVGSLVIQTGGGGGGGSAVGPPAVYLATSNFQATTLTAGNPLSVTFDSGSQTSKLLVVSASWYSTSATLTNITHAGTNLTALNAAQWYGAAQASNMLWYLINPASGSKQCDARWSGSIDEGTLIAVVLTNASQVSTFGTVAKTNAVTDLYSAITNWIACATNELVLNLNTLSNTNGPNSYNSGWSSITYVRSGPNQHASDISTASAVPAAASPITNQCTFTASAKTASIGVSIRGLTAP